jgi:hypothetical protein
VSSAIASTPKLTVASPAIGPNMVYEFTVTFTPAPGSVTQVGGPDAGYVVVVR